MLAVFQLNCLRRILKISWQDRISNKYILDRTDSEYLSVTVKMRRLQLFGHTIRLPNTRPAKVAVNWTPIGRRKRGRPKKTWRSTICDDLRAGGTNWFQAQKTAQDRERWKKSVARCCYAVGGTR